MRNPFTSSGSATAEVSNRFKVWAEKRNNRSVLFNIFGALNACDLFMFLMLVYILKGPYKRIPNIDFQDRLSLNATQMLISTFVKLPFDFKTFVLSIFEWPLKIGL